MLKPWGIAGLHAAAQAALHGYRCSKGHPRATVHGSLTAATAFGSVLRERLHAEGILFEKAAVPTPRSKL